MAYSEKIADKLRQSLANEPKVEEKKMFGGLAFMVNGKMCLTAGPNRIMCRIDPALHEQALERAGSRTVIMKGRKYKGYIYVSEEGLQKKTDFKYWITLALDYNKKAKASKKK